MYKQKFYSALKKQFVGEKIEGESGFVNLMKIKKEYYDNIKTDIRNMIDKQVSDVDEEKEIFEKLYTFFDSYLNETGTPFFNDTQIHKNLYEKVYSDKEDVSLFWKTEDLYYVKTEKNYSDMKIEKEGYKYIFDASEIENKADNNKKEIGFYLVKADKENKTLTFKIKYQQQNSYGKLKEIFDIKGTTKLQDFLINDFNNSDEYSTIKFSDDLEIRDIGNKSVKRSMLDVREKEDTLTDLVTIDFAAQGLDDVCEYLINRKDFDVKRENIKEVFATYARQDKVDYFIHKNAEKFLKEQFKQYLFNYIYDNEIILEDEGLKRAQQLNKLKKIAFNIIEYIAKFENELKNIWEKPKFVRKSNYVLTLDRLKDNIDLIEEIINHPGFNEQIKEWHDLDIIEKDFKKEQIISKDNKLDKKYLKLPVDTKFFEDIKGNIIGYFNNLDDNLDGYLIKSDNYQALNTISNKFKKKIDLIYIDPPFNTGSDFEYIDKFQDSTWLTMMNNRLKMAKNLLTKIGSFYLHLDYRASHYGKILLDNTFGKNNFLNEIIWRFGWISGYKTTASFYMRNHQNILWYKNNENYIFNKKTAYTKYQTIPYKKYKDEFKKIAYDILNVPENANINFGRTKLTFFDDNKIYKFEKNRDGVFNGEYPYESIWNGNEYEDMNSIMIQSFVPEKTEKAKELTQKPESLLKRIINISSKNESFVLDYYLGSGTTISTAHKLDRKWIGVEVGEYIYDIILPRMKKVLNGENVGITNEVNWNGGGFFKYYELESYEDVLKRSKYRKERNETNKYTFMSDEKMLDALELDYDDENIKIKFENLYPNVDIAETLSNLRGKNIKKLNDKRVIFEDDTEIIFDEMTFEKYPFIKPLIWWGEIDNE
jgi:adenine specific DNA methylase Mod